MTRKIKTMNLSIVWGSIALILSWTINHSFWWGVLHFMLGQFYIVYWLIKYSAIEAIIKTWLMA